MTILFAYDGSESADAAIAAAGKLFADDPPDAVVLTVWEPLVVEALRANRFGGWPPIPPDVTQVDQRAQKQAQRLAEHGSVSNHVLQYASRPVLVVPSHQVRTVDTSEKEETAAVS